MTRNECGENNSGRPASLKRRFIISLVAIFGEVDAMKFRSSLTLFSTAAAEPGVYGEALAQFYGGVEDPLTRRMLDVRM